MRDVLRLANAWVLDVLLDFPPFTCRAPSKGQVAVIWRAYNHASQARPFSSLHTVHLQGLAIQQVGALTVEQEIQLLVEKTNKFWSSCRRRDMTKLKKNKA